MKLFFWTTLLFALAFLPSCKKDDPVVLHPPTDPCGATKKKTPLEIIWQNDLPNYVASPYLSMYPLVYGDKIVYSGGHDANQKLIVADGKTGAVVLEKSIDFNFSAAYFQVHGDYLYYKKYTNNAPIRRISLNSNAPAADFTASSGKTANYFSFFGNALLAVQADSTVILKHTETGAERTLFSHPASIAPPLLWNLPNGDTVLTILYLMDAQHYLKSINITSGLPLFSIGPIARNGIQFDPATFFLHNGMVCLTSHDYLDCYDAKSGNLRWTYQAPLTLYGSSLTAFGSGDFIVVGGIINATICLSAATGTEIWNLPITIKLALEGPNPTFIGQRMFLVRTPRLQAYNLERSCTDWDFTSPNASGNSSGFRSGIAYHPGLNTIFILDEGHILAIRNQD
ncbi:MAG: PQQ-binding-like beta-propeller repeat protein [Saprospiraceae bacterium]